VEGDPRWIVMVGALERKVLQNWLRDLEAFQFTSELLTRRRWSYDASKPSDASRR
jgi:hypothetical protein